MKTITRITVRNCKIETNNIEKMRKIMADKLKVEQSEIHFRIEEK